MRIKINRLKFLVILKTFYPARKRFICRIGKAFYLDVLFSPVSLFMVTRKLGKFEYPSTGLKRR